MKHTYGFTATELLIVMAIVGILLAVGVPHMIAWRQDCQLNTATRDVQAAIQRLRIQALKEKSFVEIKFDAVVNEYEVNIHLRGVEGGRTKALRNQLPPGIRISRISFRNKTLRFNSKGLPANGAGSVSFINQRGSTRRIVVPITGNSRISA
jgi:prepilin-type N-terminal cleavage/methylation domain-containing protein